MYFTESLGEGQITLTDPADLPQDLAECPGQDGGQNKADQDHAQPVETGGDDGGRPSGKGLLTGGEPSGPHADLSAQAAGAHTGVDGGAVHLQSEHAGGCLLYTSDAADE